MNRPTLNFITMRTAHLLAIWTLFGVLLSACGGQGLRIKGRVTDTTGAVISGARVQTEPLTDPVTTNQNGDFIISRQLVDSGASQRPIKAGRYLVTVSATGYQEVSAQVMVNDASADETQVYQLKRDVGDFNTQDPVGGGAPTTRVDQPRPPKFGPP